MSLNPLYAMGEATKIPATFDPDDHLLPWTRL